MNSMVFPVVARAFELQYFVVGAAMDNWQEEVLRPSGFWTHQFIITSKGEGTLCIGSKHYRLLPGTAVYMPPNVGYSFNRIGDEWNTWWVVFDGEGVISMLQSLGFHGFTICDLDGKSRQHGEGSERIYRIIRRIFNVLSFDELFGGYYASAGLYELMIEFCRQSQLIPSELYSGSRISRAIVLINNNCCAKLTMDDLCRVADLSETHLCRLFKSYFGMRPIEYINRRRVIYAKEMIKNSQHSIEAVSLKLGFESVSYFGKLFKRYEGVSPSEYRKMM